MIPVKPLDVTWTDEQWEAIYDEGHNIIVSAGAGSGKTAVLTERVIRKLRDGIHINELLILTFTKAAAGEMADRIRKKIKKIPELSSELDLLNSSYITTFDSFALSVVRKYHYLINVSSDINIIDSNVILIKKNEILNDIFLEYYENGDAKFLDMIKSFCVKDDSDIRNYILNISNKLDLSSSKYEYLSTYLDNYFSSDKIDRDICEYYNIIWGYVLKIRDIVCDISYLDNEFASKINDSLMGLYEASCYDDIVNRLNIKLPMVPRGSDESIKSLKASINDILKEIKRLCCYDSVDDIRKTIYLTRDTLGVIIDIILEFTDRVNKYKDDNNSYEFNDIAVMAINILNGNSDVRDELYNSFNEIMIDEYQDTNDLQEEFISMISNHNVYMVGDIKQSIYRFRNANPNIFKDKYDGFSVSDIDKKIDLNKNFRSRNEVIDNINTIFNLIMNDSIGGASYIDSHQMIFGNKAYLKDALNHSNDMEIYCYNYDRELGYSKDEIEAFIVGRDILDKINNKYLVFDKDSGSLRNIRYDDFAIILDRASSFDLYKKIFSYLGIPISLLKSSKMNDSDIINVFRNIIRFIIKIRDREFDSLFKYLFVSIMRCFLFDVDDNVIFNYFYNNSFKSSKLYRICFSISKKIDYITIHDVIDIIISSFNCYERLICIGDIDNNLIRISKLCDLAYSLEKMGYDIRMFSSYLMELSVNNYSIEYDVSSSNSSSVKIMTIHKSKGLEYPVCYFGGLYKKFNISDLNEKFLYDKNYGIVVPYNIYNVGVGETIYKDLVRYKYLRDEISEKIRLFYVALTRAREKIILVKPYSDSINDNCNATSLEDSLKEGYRSFDDIVNSIYFRLSDKYNMIDINNIGISKDYNLIKISNYKDNISSSDVKLDVYSLNIDNNIINSKTYSKLNNKIISSYEYDNINMGSKLHEILELIDLKNPNYDIIDNKFYVDVVKDFLNQDIVSNISSAKVYREYEFIYESDNNKFHGIIDLMLEYDSYIDIIDYKLKDTNDDNYIKQLNGYKDYISKISNKIVNIYLYSLIERKVFKL